MQHHEFDDLAKALGSASTRRSALGALAGLAGCGVLGLADGVGKSRQKRRRQRRRVKQARRRDRRGSTVWQRGISVRVINTDEDGPGLPVEFGYELYDQPCCQGQAAYTIPPGASQLYTTEEPAAYIWIDNRYFIYLNNPVVKKPFFRAAINGATGPFRDDCCKPGGQVLYNNVTMDAGERKMLDLAGRAFLLERNDDLPEYKAFSLRA
ncbi:MAG: hypothetical protein QM692_04380 [Thermomicrobiales bacterium]